MAIYRIFVSDDGTLQRYERVAGNPELQAVAEPVLRHWHFRKIKQRKSLISWWSFVGLLFPRLGQGRSVSAAPGKA